MNSTFILNRVGNVVEGPMGLQMPEKLARTIEASARGLPKDFTYRRRSFGAKQENVSPDARTEVSIITTDAVDRDGECVLSVGGDWKQYNRVVLFCHDYKSLPAGFNQWIMSRTSETKAKTQYPTAPPDWSGPWLPSAIWHFLTQPIPTMGDKSIGFLPMNVRGATAEEKRLRPQLDSVPIIDKWLGLEYSCVLVPCNQEATLDAVSKGIESGAITKEFANKVRQLMIDESTKTVISMTSPVVITPPSATEPATKAAGAESSNAAGGNVVDTSVGELVDKKPPMMKTSSVKMMMPAHVKAAMKGLAKQIAPEHMHDDGAEADPSITIHSGMAGQDAEAVKSMLADQPPVNCRLGKCMVGSGKSMDGMEDVDHVGISATGKDLSDLHKKLLALPHSNDNPTFSPSVKIATCKKGMGGDYADMPGLSGLGMKCLSVKFIDGDGNGTDIPLAGKPTKKTARPDGNDPDNDGDNDPVIMCPSCNEQAKQVAGVNVAGIGPCDKYVCEKCDTMFLVPEQFHRYMDTISGDGTNQSNVSAALPDGTPGKTLTANAAAAPAPPARPAPTPEVVPFVRPEVMELARQKILAQQKAALTAELVPAVMEAIDRRMGKV